MRFQPLVSIVIPTHNRREKLLRLIDSIKNSDYPQNSLEIIVVDDASTDKTFETLKEHWKKIKVIRNNMERFPSACRNIGIKESRGDFIFLIDDDNILVENTIVELVSCFRKYEAIGLAGPVMCYLQKPSVIWSAGARLNPPILIATYIRRNRTGLGSESHVIECDYVPNAFMIRREVAESVGLFDERFPIGFEEADFALRVREKDYKVAVFTSARILHDVPMLKDIHVTEKRAYWRGRSRVLFYRKHEPIRCLFLPIDIIGFVVLLLVLKMNIRKRLSLYINGISEGLSSDFSS